MKKLFMKRNFIQKIFLSIIIVLLLSFAMPTQSQADVGGVLIGPITDLLSGIGDIVTAGLQLFLIDGNSNANLHGNLLTSFMLPVEDYYANKSNYPDLEFKEGDGNAETILFNQDNIDTGWLLAAFDTDNFCIPVCKYSPQKIFAGQVPALDINFITPRNWGSDAMNDRSVANVLHDTIASWYVSLRNLTIVALLTILLYVGIRIVISSTASDKAKYKEMLMNWVVALCILFFLHYIMLFTLTITQSITDAIAGNSNTVNNIPITVTNMDIGTYDNGTVNFNTDLMGLARFQVQMKDMGSKILYTIIYLALVIYTVMFTFTYLKRAIMMAFLTLIAPLVAITYPIDKMGDGKSQAFNMWLKEYIFNALLQPFHLIIYTVFVGAAMDLASKNPIYAIVVLAFITPAEKILRKFFGFDKASTSSPFGATASVVGGAAVMSHFRNALSKGNNGKGNGGKNNNIRMNNPPERDSHKIGEYKATSNDNIRQNESPQLGNGNQDGNGNDGGPMPTDGNGGGLRPIDGNNGGTMPANENDGGPGSEPPIIDESTPKADRHNNDRQQEKASSDKPWQVTENDTRGLGQWAGDSIKGVGKMAGDKIGAGAKKAGTAVSKKLGNTMVR